jgi:hypothetical protein
MYEIINRQFLSGKSLVLPKYNNAISRSYWPNYNHDLYPVNIEYFHELNPYFLCNLYLTDFFKFSETITVRDGYVTFADFLLKHSTNLEKLGTQLYIIHPSLAPLVPQSIRHYFACREIVQKNQITLSKANKVTLFGLICENSLGSLNSLSEKLSALKDLSQLEEIEVCTPLRRNMFKKVDKESSFTHEALRLINDKLSGKKIKYLTTEEFLDSSHDKNSFLIDLTQENFLTTDSFVHFYVQSRGGTVNNHSLRTPPKNSIFNLDLSFHHELHITPLPQESDVFMDLLLYRKQNPSKELVYDPIFHNLVRKLLSSPG